MTKRRFALPQTPPGTMVVNDPLFSLFSPEQDLERETREQMREEMQKLAARHLEIEQARVQAEVAFLQEERHAHWHQQPVEAIGAKP